MIQVAVSSAHNLQGMTAKNADRFDTLRSGIIPAAS
jgi:hypothetical protein